VGIVSNLNIFYNIFLGEKKKTIFMNMNSAILTGKYVMFLDIFAQKSRQ